MKEFESCEKCKYRYKSDCEYPCERCVHGCVVKEYYEPMTNADRIRSMSDEDLAINMMCPNENGLAEIDCDKCDNCNCYECLLKWLQSEVEE